ncbi:MAG: nuclear transport factor 2 family protein [Ferruginibacter sp.]|nr:nuclear transport factor 2 family protein [Ferruginibacter sp.]
MLSKKIATVVYSITLGLIFSACNHANEQKGRNPVDENTNEAYVPDSKQLHDSIVHMDSVLFGAYNTCNLVTMADCFSEDIEFYHDKGGLMTSKDSIMAATKKNICGKVTRVLVNGSIEVYPIAGYGAIQMGRHYFINSQEPKPANPAIGKFVHTWKNENGKWRLTRVISLH